VVVWKYRERNVTYIVFEPERGQETPLYPRYNKERLPSLLFFSAGAMTLCTLGLLWYFLPDLPRRTWLWLRALGRYRIELAGMLRLPPSGPALVVTDAVGQEALDQVERGADRAIHFVTLRDPAGFDARSKRILTHGGVVGLSLSPLAGEPEEQLVQEAMTRFSVPILPVHHVEMTHNGKRFVYVVAGALIEPGSPVAVVRDVLRHLAIDTERRVASGEALEKEAVEHCWVRLNRKGEVSPSRLVLTLWGLLLPLSAGSSGNPRAAVQTGCTRRG
jgi:hypothetical protein